MTPVEAMELVTSEERKPNRNSPSEGEINDGESSGGNRADTFSLNRRLLLSIAYRMLGSIADAEDIVQDAFLRWQRAAETKVESPKAFLVTIVSRLCIDHLKSARMRREQYVGPWLPEPVTNELL